MQTRDVEGRRRRRVFSLDPVENFRPPVLTGHKDTPLAVFWAGAPPPPPALLTPQPYRRTMGVPRACRHLGASQQGTQVTVSPAGWRPHASLQVKD